MEPIDYRHIVSHYERCLASHPEGARAVDWKNEKSASIRYDVMLGVLERSAPSASLLDFGCGLAGLRDYMEACGFGEVEYKGLEISADFAAGALARRPDVTIVTRDVLLDGMAGLEADYIVMNGVFTRRETLSVEAMTDYMHRLVGTVFPAVRVGLAFNVMSHAVDWKSDVLFHPDPTALVDWLSRDVSRHFTLRNDYGLHETTVYVFRQPRAARASVRSSEERSGA